MWFVIYNTQYVLNHMKVVNLDVANYAIGNKTIIEGHSFFDYITSS